MTFTSLLLLLFCCTVFVFGNQYDRIEADYYFSRTSRDRNPASKCEDVQFNRDCGVKCGGTYTCVFEKCFCFMHKKHSKHPGNTKLNPRFHDIIFVTDSVELNDSLEKVKQLVLRKIPSISLPSEDRSGLRHHIAHFCENLETARQCIRSCMKIGKPAFCGKDHKCYCGHKYDEYHTDPVVDPNVIYNQFNDLYAKYFGTTEMNPSKIVELEVD